MGTKIFLVENNHYVLQAMSLLLEHDDQFELIGKTDQAEKEVFQDLPVSPDAILWDMNLMNSTCPETIKFIREKYPRVALVATSLRPEYAEEAQAAGMDGFLVKHLLPRQFLTKLQSILNIQENQTTPEHH